MSIQKFFKSPISTSTDRLASRRLRTKRWLPRRSLRRPLLEALEDRVMLACNFAGFGQELENDVVALGTPLNTLLAAGSRVPLVGNRLANDPAAAALKIFNDSRLGGISEKLSGVDKANGRLVGDKLFEILGPGGTGLIANRNSLVVTPNTNNCTIDVTMPFSKSLPDIPLGGVFGLGLAGLPFSVTASGGIKVSEVKFTQSAVFDFKANQNTGALTGPLNISARASLIPGSQIDATIGFLKSTLEDMGTTAVVQFNSQSGVKFDAHVKLKADATFGGNKQFPSVAADFVLDWDTFKNVNAKPQGVRFDNVAVSLGEFLTNLIRPVVEKVQIVTEPLQPIADFLKTPVPGVSDLAEAAGLGTVTIKDFIQLYADANAQSDANSQIEMYLKVLAIIDKINGINVSDPNAMIIVGNLDLTGEANTLINGGTLPEKLHGVVKNWEQSLDSLGGSGSQIKDLLKGAQENIKLEFPLIQKPLEGVFKLFVGQHADLVTLDLKYAVDSPAPSGGSIFGVAFGFNGGVKLDAELKLGYDTYGVEKFVQSGRPEDLADGFYLDQSTHFTLSSKLGVFAGAGIVVLSVAIEGGLQIPESHPLSVNLNMNAAGNPDSDPTRLHFDEIDLNPSCLFNASGKLEASVNIVVTVGVVVDVPLAGEVTLGFTKELQIAAVTIFDFDSPGKQCLGLSGDAGPKLAELNPGTGELILSMGPNVGHLRGPEAPVDGNENFFVKSEGGRIWVFAYGVAQSFPVDQVATIIADGGSGNDVVIIDSSVNKNVHLAGGYGNDRLEHFGTGSDVEMFGEDGDDVLVGGDSKEVMNGGPNNDLLIGGRGDDILLGVDGKDKLFGGEGVDFVDGGPGDDEIDAGPGRIQSFSGGGLGNDILTVYPGIGSPVLDGGGLLAQDDPGSIDKLIVSGSAGKDIFDVAKAGNDNSTIAISRCPTGIGRCDFPKAIGIEEIFIDPGAGKDQVTINDLSGTVAKSVAVNQKEFLNPDNEADTVIVNATANNDSVQIKEKYSFIRSGYCDLTVPKRPRCVPDQYGTSQVVTGIGPIIGTPNASGDQLIVNTLGGNDQVALEGGVLPLSSVSLPPGTVQVDAGSGADYMYVGSISSATIARGGTGADLVHVGTLSNLVPGNVDGIRAPLTLEGGANNDTFIFDDRRSSSAKTGKLSRAFQGEIGNLISGFGMGSSISYDAMESVYVQLGSGGNLATIARTPAAFETQSVELHTGAGADTVNVQGTDTSVFVHGGGGLDTVNVGRNGSARSIAGPLTITNVTGKSAVTVDDSADKVARTGLIYNRNEYYSVVGGLTAGGDIFLRSGDLSSLTVRAGSGGNTFRIHDTPASNTPGGLKTTLWTGAGADSVTVDGTTGALSIDVSTGANNVYVGSENGGIDRILGEVYLGGFLGYNSVRIDDRLTTSERILEHTIAAAAYTRTAAAPIKLSDVSSFDLWTGSAADTINVQGRPSPLGANFSILAGAGNDTVNFGNAANQLVQFGTVSVNGGPGTADALNIYDQGSFFPQTYTFDFVFNDPRYPYFSSNDALILYSNYESLSHSGGTEGDTILVKGLSISASLDGGGGSNLFTGPNLKNRWQITGANSGLLNDNITYSSMQSLSGGSNDDTFSVSGGGRVGGTINGLLGQNTLDYTALPVDGSISNLVARYAADGNAASSHFVWQVD